MSYRPSENIGRKTAKYWYSAECTIR